MGRNVSRMNAAFLRMKSCCMAKQASNKSMNKSEFTSPGTQLKTQKRYKCSFCKQHPNSFSLNWNHDHQVREVPEHFAMEDSAGIFQDISHIQPQVIEDPTSVHEKISCDQVHPTFYKATPSVGLVELTRKSSHLEKSIRLMPSRRKQDSHAASRRPHPAQIWCWQFDSQTNCRGKRWRCRVAVST